MIYVRVGKPGEGKSLTASMDIKDLLDQGVSVYTNLHLDETRSNYHYFDTADYEVIFDLQDGWIYFDEGQVLLDARQWEKLPVEFKYLLQKGRHEGLDFVILTQNINQIDVLARRLVHEGDFVWRVFSTKRFNFGIFLIFKLDLTKIEEQHYGGWPDLRIATKSDWEYYNSFALRTNKDPRIDIECDCGHVHKISKKSPRRSHLVELGYPNEKNLELSSPSVVTPPAEGGVSPEVGGVERSEGGKDAGAIYHELPIVRSEVRRNVPIVSEN